MRGKLFLVLVAISILALSTTALATSLRTTKDYQAITSLASQCIKENIFTQPLVDLSTGNIWGMAAYLPFNNGFASQLGIKYTDNKASGFIVIFKKGKYENYSINIGDIGFKGKSSSENKVKEADASYFYFGTNAIIGPMGSTDYSKVEFLTNDNALVLEVFQNYGDISSENYQVKLSTTTSSVSWYVLQKTNEYKKYLSLLEKLGY